MKTRFDIELTDLVTAEGKIGSFKAAGDTEYTAEELSVLSDSSKGLIEALVPVIMAAINKPRKS